MNDLCNPELLEKIVDGTATPAEHAAFEAHAIECITCARELAWQRRERALFAVRQAQAVAPLWKDVEARITAPPARRSASWMAGVVAAAAAVLLLVKSVPMALHHDGPHPVVVAPAAALPEPAAKQADGQTWSFPLEGGERVVVSDVEGSVNVRLSDKSNVLRVLASHDEDLNGWAIHVERKGKEISARVECEHTCSDKPSVDFVVDVPLLPSPSVTIDTQAADVDVDRVASVVVHSLSGDVHVNGSGVSRVSTTSGDISIEDAPSVATKLDSVSGDVSWSGTCAKDCNLGIDTVSGDVDVTPDEQSHYDVDVRTTESSHEHVRDGVKGKIRVTTVSGDVEVPDDERPSGHALLSVGAPSGGLVQAIEVKVGDKVTKGQVLVRLVPLPERADVAELEKDVAELEKAAAQMEMLFRAGAATTAQVAQAKSAITLAREKVNRTQGRVAAATVEAPASGVVLAIHTHVDDAVPANARLVTLSNK